MHKCGTSWLYHMLEQHPEIHLLQRDTHFFSKQSEYEKGLDFYKKKLVFSNSGQSIALEMSNDYLRSAGALERIKTSFPDAKLFCCLRNPIDRAYSHYLQEIKTGATREENFEKALRKRERYISNGYYAEGLKRLFSLFPREQVKVLFFDDIVSKPLELLQELWRFLDIEPIALETSFVQNKVNKARLPKSVKLEQFQNHAYHKLQRTALGNRFWHLARRLGLGRLVRSINKKEITAAPMSDALRQELQNTFQKDIAEVFDLLDRHDLLWA